MRNATNGTAAYRITLSESDAGNMTVGGLVSGLANESSPTSRIADLRVHPYMPVGASIIRSRVLNIPDSGISDTTAVTSVQDYMSVDWPQIQFTYDARTLLTSGSALSGSVPRCSQRARARPQWFPLATARLVPRRRPRGLTDGRLPG
jgi:hypothetical protein